MIVRVNWHPKSPEMYHVYQCDDYLVEITGYAAESTTPLHGKPEHQSGPSNVNLVLNNGKHILALSNGDTAYIMNDEGKTFDIIRTV